VNAETKMSTVDNLTKEENKEGAKDRGGLDDHQAIKQEMESLKRELDNAKSEVAVSAYLQESLAQSERQKESLEEEMQTLQTLLVEATDGHKLDSQFLKLRKRAKVLEAENQDLKVQLRLTEGRRNSTLAGGGGGGRSPLAPGMDRESLLGSAAVLTDKTKNMVRKMKSTVVQSFPAGGVADEDEIRKAEADSQLLKSLVEPLEEQIVALKGKLRETDSLLQEYEKRQASSLLEMECVGAWLNGEDKSKLDVRLAEAAGDGYSEEEGQLYHAILAARIGMITQELEMYRWDREEVVGLLEAERSKFKQMKEKHDAKLAQHVNHISRILEVVGSEEQRAEMRAAISGIRREEDAAESTESSSVTRIISEEEWEKLQLKLDTLRIDVTEKTPKTIDSEEMEKLKADLRTCQKERETLLKDREHLQNNCSKYKDDLSKEAAFRKEMEETWNSRGVEYRTNVTELQGRLQKAEQALERVAGLYKLIQESGRRELRKVVVDREKIVRELRRLQEENDNLVGKHADLSTTLANEVINLPDSQEDMQLLLLKYREDLITSKIGKERAQEKMKSEIAFMRNQLTAEQQTRTVLEEQYSSDLQGLKEHIRSLEPCSQELDSERNKRRALEARLEELSKARSEDGNLASKARSEKDDLSSLVSELRIKVGSLQGDLDNSVAVQNDFVRLSQSLQVELEKIRQSEKEVRWQHEDDVSECNSCKTGFSRKRKQNCKHCGRIFCPDCLSKQVASGSSGRPSSVCDVCHTLLEQHSAPYFASEPPKTDA